MIVQKKKICNECGNLDYIFSKGRCKQCASKGYKLKKISPKKVKEKKETSDIRSVYFDYHVSKCKKSEESGCNIIEASRVNICHILPKRRYESVQGHLDNYIYLTPDEHSRFDRLLDEMDFDKLKAEFPTAIILLYLRFKKLIPFVKETDGKLFNRLREYFEL